MRERNSFNNHQNVNQRRLQRVERFTFDDYILNNSLLYKYSYKCAKNVMWKNRVVDFLAHLPDFLYQLKENLKDEVRWENITGEKVETFEIHERGKSRLIQNISFSNRIIQKLLTEEVLQPIFVPTFHNHNCASREGMGIQYARQLCESHIRSLIDRFPNQTIYGLTLDFRSYFASIDINLLLDKINKYPIDDKLFRFISFFTYKHRNKETNGLHLGSQLSQMYALLYPSQDWDWFIAKYTKYFCRYMDDTYILSTDYNFLENLREILYNQAHLLKLEISKTDIYNLQEGFPFLKCKYVIKNRKIKKYLIKNYRRKVRKKLYKLKSKNATISEFESVIQSHIGYLKYFNTDKRAITLSKELKDILRRLKSNECFSDF